MTKEEQRFTAAVAAMNGLLANNSSIFNTGGGDSIDCDNLASTSIAYADTLIKKLDNKVDNKEIPERPYVEDLLDSHIKKNEPLPPYEKDLFANSKNGDGKKITAIDLPYIESFPSQNSNSKTTPDPITEPSMNAIDCGWNTEKITKKL